MKFELQPILVGDLILLRPLTVADYDSLYAVASDPLIWEQHPESDRYKREVFQRYFDGAMDSKGAFAIIERKSGRIIGSSRYCNLDETASEVEIGWTFLERAFWGGTYNRELKTLMIEHAFRFVDRVLFVVGENNTRSQKALAKIGARFLERVEAPSPDETGKVVFVLTRDTAELLQAGKERNYVRDEHQADDYCRDFVVPFARNEDSGSGEGDKPDMERQI